MEILLDITQQQRALPSRRNNDHKGRKLFEKDKAQKPPKFDGQPRPKVRVIVSSCIFE